MKTLFKWITLAVILSFLTVWLILPTYFSWRLSSMMETKTRVRQVFLNPKAMIFKNLKIDNIPGYMQLPVAMKAKIIQVDAPLINYAKNEIVIEKIVVDGLFLGLVFDNTKKTTGNWSRIMSEMTPTDAEKKKHPRTVVIKEIEVRNITANVYYKNNQHFYKLDDIDNIKIRNLKSDGGIPTEQIMNTALGQTLHQLFLQQNIGNMMEGIFPLFIPFILIPAA